MQGEVNVLEFTVQGQDGYIGQKVLPDRTFFTVNGNRRRKDGQKTTNLKNHLIPVFL
jgi:hypothetical protein